MGFLDKGLAKAKELAGKNPDKVDSVIDKAGDMFDRKTGGKHAQHTDRVQEKAGEFLTGRTAEAPEVPDAPDGTPTPDPDPEQQGRPQA